VAASAPRTVVFSVWGPISRDELAGLCDRVCRLLGTAKPDVAVCEAASVPADAVTVDALVRLQLLAHRIGCQVRLRNASQELLELVAFMGLAGVVPDER
jgi:ABC-type transporter Mla MlaB component